jgi:hypothetical protein
MASLSEEQLTWSKELPEWVCEDFDDIMVAIINGFDAASSCWILEELLPLRDQLRSSEGPILDTQFVNKVLTALICSYPMPFHGFSFLLCLELPKPGQESLSVRGGLFLHALRTFKVEALTCALPCEMDSRGRRQEQFLYAKIFNTRTFVVRTIEGGSHLAIGEKTIDSSANDNLVVAVSCRGALFVIQVSKTQPWASVSTQLEVIERMSLSTADRSETGAGAQLGFLTYLGAPELAACLSSDSEWMTVWDRVQDCDFCITLYPDVRASDLNAVDPVAGAMQKLRISKDGSVFGNKHTLCVFADGVAAFKFDHANFDGSPAAWMVERLNNLAQAAWKEANIKEHCITATTTTLKIQRLSVSHGSPSAFSREICDGITKGQELCSRIDAQGRLSARIVLKAFGRDAAVAKGLSIDGLFQAAVQLAISDFGRENVRSSHEVINIRHQRGARLDAFIVNSPQMAAFVDQCTDSRRHLPYSPGLALILKTAVEGHKTRIKEHAQGKRTPSPYYLKAKAASLEQNENFDVVTALCKIIPSDMASSERCDSPYLGSLLFKEGVLVSNCTSFESIQTFGTACLLPINIGYIFRGGSSIECDICWKEGQDSPTRGLIEFTACLESALETVSELIAFL